MHEKKDKKYFYSQNLFQLKESFQVPSTRKGEWRISVEGTKKEQEEFHACSYTQREAGESHKGKNHRPKT